MIRINDVNQVRLCGTVTEAPCLDHTLYGESFYTLRMDVPRLSGAVDVLPVTLPGRCERLPAVGDRIMIQGQLRSYNRRAPSGSKLVLTVFAHSVEHSEQPPCNEVELTGYLCKRVVPRITPFMREIGDVLLAVNRAYNKSDYLPCIVWGKNAHFAGSLAVGCRISLSGRLQSRGYQKTLENGLVAQRVAYEVSCSNIVAE